MLHNEQKFWPFVRKLDSTWNKEIKRENLKHTKTWFPFKARHDLSFPRNKYGMYYNNSISWIRFLQIFTYFPNLWFFTILFLNKTKRENTELTLKAYGKINDLQTTKHHAKILYKWLSLSRNVLCGNVQISRNPEKIKNWYTVIGKKTVHYKGKTGRGIKINRFT